MMTGRRIRLAIALSGSLCASGAAAQGVRIGLERGEAYSFQLAQSFGKLEMTPHIAAWIEDGRGAFVKTIYVSLKGGKQDFWVGKRIHPLPVWETRRAAEKIPDAVGGASPAPKAPALLEWRIAVPRPLASAGYTVWLEANIGFDYNESWPNDGKEVWGQPSLLLRADIAPGAAAGKEFALSPVGRARGAKGDWTGELKGMTSALRLFEKATAKIE
jgi:hypothetical protein